MIRVLLVDDQELVREGLRRILHADEGFEIVGECVDGVEVPAAAEELCPDVVVMDVRMKERRRDRGDASLPRSRGCSAGPGPHHVR